MPIEIEGPDGAVIEFPDDTPRDVMQNAMRQHYSTKPQQPEKVKYPNTIGGNIAQAVEDYVPQGVRDVSRQFRSGLTFGASDVIPGIFGGKPAEQLQAETASALERHPYAGEAAKIGGMMAGMTPVARGVGLAAKGVSAVPLAGRIAASPLVQAAATGAITGGAESGIKGEDIGEGAALGGIFGAGGQALGSAVGGAIKGAGNLAQRSAGPTSAELLAEKNAAYDVVKNSGTTFSTPSMVDLGKRLINAYDQFGWSKHVNPKGVGPIKQFADIAASGAASPHDIDNLLKVSGNLIDSIDKSDRKLGYTVKNTITDWLQSSAPQEAGELLKARSLAAKTIKDRQIQDALEKATKRASQSGRGGNLQNTIRQEIGKLEGRAGWSPQEQAMIQEINQGTPIMNMARHVSGFAPSTGVLPAAMTLGAAGMTGGMSLPASAGAWVVKKAADAATRRKVGLLADLVRSGGQLPPPNVMQRLGPAISPLIARGLLAGGIGGM